MRDWDLNIPTPVAEARALLVLDDNGDLRTLVLLDDAAENGQTIIMEVDPTACWGEPVTFSMTGRALDARKQVRAMRRMAEALERQADELAARHLEDGIAQA